MNRRKGLIFVIVLALIVATAGILLRLNAGKKLGLPGVKTRLLAASGSLEIVLPERVLDFTSQSVEQAKVVLDTLPKDTSFGQRLYQAPDGFWMQLNVVMMGADRTSIHKPQICLPGQGFSIEKTEETTIPIERPFPYNLPVIKLTTSKVPVEGQGGSIRGIYVYWYVADGVLSADPTALRRMWMSTKHLFQTGVLQRWAYIVYFSAAEPGQEETAYNRMKLFIAASVPEFQLTPKAKETTTHP